MLTASFVSLSNLLAVDDWSFFCFKTNKPSKDTYGFSFSKQAVVNLAAVLQAKRYQRVFIACNDRALFMAALLASFAAHKTIFLPHMLTATSLTELMTEPNDVLITDQINLISAHINTISSLDTFVDTKSFTLPPISLNQTLTFYTSGSSGTPKAIKKKLFQLEAEINCLYQLWGSDKGTFHSTVSHQHIYGFLFSVLFPICAGRPVMRYTHVLWEELFAQLSENDIIISSPSHLGRFPVDIELAVNPRHVFSSGAPLSHAFASDTYRRLKVFPIEVYGSTETGGIAYRTQENIQSFWRPFPRISLSINENNHLCLQSPYLPNQNLFTTEDYASFNEDGTFNLHGRADRIVKFEGKRICLNDIEHKLRLHNDILDVAVISLSTEHRSELGVVAVLTKDAQNIMDSVGKADYVRTLRAYLSVYFEPILIPKKWRFVTNIPQNEQGKRSVLILEQCFKKDGE